MRIDCGLGIAEIRNQQSAITIRNRQCAPQSPLRNPQSIRNPQSAIRIDMITPLTPLEFARRTRALYSDHEALVDGALRLTYAQFFDRCDRWSAALQALGVARADVDEQDLLTINYTSGTTSRPKGVMITHRNAYINVVGTLLHIPMQMTDRYLWTLPMFHANGWTYVWTVTAVGGAHVCLRKVDPAHIFP